jgi:hypothetical protein
MALEWILEMPYGSTLEGGTVYSLVRDARSGELFRTYQAYIARRGKQKWEVFFPARFKQNDKTFRTLKAAKAYAVAIASLEN